MATVSYKDAGVDIDAGNQFVENIKPYEKYIIFQSNFSSYYNFFFTQNFLPG